MQLTPLRVREIGAFLKRRIGPKSVPIYGGAAQLMGRPLDGFYYRSTTDNAPD